MISAFRNFILQFPKILSITQLTGVALTLSQVQMACFLQMFDDVVNQRELHVVGIRNDEFFATAFRMQGNGVVGEYREANLSFVADDFNTVGLLPIHGRRNTTNRNLAYRPGIGNSTDVIFRGI